jgi:LuxR family maltose regulon positive regulatory protein
MLHARGTVALWNGELAVAQTALEAALETARHARLRAAQLDATATLALVCALRGELKRAARLATSVHSTRPAALLALALCELEWDDAAESIARAECARDLADATGDRISGLHARIVAAVAAAGEPRGSEDARLELAALAAEGAERLPLLAPSLEALRCRLALATGDATAARGPLAEADESPQHSVAAARLALACRDVEAARGDLDGLLPDRVDLPLGLRVEATVLRAVAAELAGDEEDACAWIERALGLAEAEAIRRPFLGVGSTMVGILRRTIRRASSHRWLAGSLLAVLDGREPADGHTARELLDPLSDRETIVLRYLPTMMSNQEIAGELFVSVNTIKTHLKSIYRKLGASDRREAVRLARELRLIG